MKKTNLTAEQQQIVQSNPGLKRYLESLLTQVDFTPRSWLYETWSTDNIRDAWLKELQPLESGSPYEQRVFQFDTSQLKKWGPQGGHAPISELFDEIIAPSFSASPMTESAFSTVEWTVAKKLAVKHLKLLGCVGLRPASLEHVVDDMRARDTLETNSGWPLFTRRNKPEVVAASIADARSGKYKEYPAIVLFRTYNGKTRPVWMYPMATNLVEGSYFQVLQSTIMNSRVQSDFFAPWVGFSRVQELISHYYEKPSWYHGHGPWSMSATDFSETDAHFKLSASEQVCDVLELCFNEEHRAGLRESIRHMHNIPLVVGPDEIVYGEHGVSSGSNWTNFIETIFDMILSYYVALLTGFPNQEVGNRDDRPVINRDYAYWIRGLYGIGDDMTWITTEYREDFPKFINKIGASVGQVIKAEKATNEPDALVSLQRLFQRGYNRPDGLCRAVYPTLRALKSSVFPERFHNPKRWSSDMFCIRQFMILENCVDHPRFENFVKFICQGNRHLIPFAKESDKYLDEVSRESKLLPGLNVTYNQEKRDASLATFASIRIARNL